MIKAIAPKSAKIKMLTRLPVLAKPKTAGPIADDKIFPPPTPESELELELVLELPPVLPPPLQE